MDLNIILAGVGGQGILSIAYVIDGAALREAYLFKQAEVHGMSQRGGAVQSHLRISKERIWSDLIPDGELDLVLSVEPMEALRYCPALRPAGTVVSSMAPFLNIPNYPDHAGILDRVAAMERHVLVDADAIARLAGSPRSNNMVTLGAASFLMPFSEESHLALIGDLFRAKGERVVDVNRRAFTLGRDASAFYRAGLEVGIPGPRLWRLGAALDPGELDPASVATWKEALEAHPRLLDHEPEVRVPGTIEVARAALQRGQIG